MKKRFYRCLAPSCRHEASELVLEDVTQAIECSRCGGTHVEVVSEQEQEKKEMAWKTDAFSLPKSSFGYLS